MSGELELKHIWNGPGYRDLRIDAVDPTTGREYSLRITAKDMPRLIGACADAVKQIGLDAPIDWDLYPTQIYWPEVKPWRPGPRTALTDQEDA